MTSTVTLLIRAALIFFASMFFNMFYTSVPYLNDTVPTKFQYSIILAIAPLLLSFLPLFGIQKLMELNNNINPFISFVIMIAVSLGTALLVDKQSQSNDNDPFTKFIQNEDHLELGPLKIDRKFMAVLIITLFLDMFVHKIAQLNARNNHSNLVYKASKKAISNYFMEQKKK